jgi:glutaredoxin
MQRLRSKLVLSSLGICACLGLAGGAIALSRSMTESQIQAAAPTTVQTKPAVTALARHLKKVGAKMYGAYWCPHCNHQKEVFGEATFKAYIAYIECAEDGANANPKLCRAKKISGFPTWEIKGKFYPGTQSLEELADLSGYKGSRAF